MMKWMVLVAVALGGCATTAVAGADRVLITSSQEAAQGCRFLGQDTAMAHSMPINVTTKNAITTMKNKAIARGGNLVVSPGPQVTMPGPAATMTGDIYACSPAPEDS